MFGLTLNKNIPLPSLYFSHKRKCYERDGVLYGHADYVKLKDGEKLVDKVVRFRSIGDVTCKVRVKVKQKQLMILLQK